MNKKQLHRDRISNLISLALIRQFLTLRLYIENHICHTYDKQKGANVILTISGESQLSAGHICIISTPGVITHSTPLVVHANFNTALRRIGSKPCKSDLASHAASCIKTGV